MYGLYQVIYFAFFDILKTLVSPFFLAITVILYFQYNKVSPRPFSSTLLSIAYGILGGLLATVVFIYLKIYIVPRDFMYILGFAILLSFINTRFICFSYSGSLVALSSLIFGYPKVNSYEIMALVAVFHITESFLILLNGKSQSSLGYLKVNDSIVKGITFNRFWPLPFVIFVGDILIKPVTLIAILTYGDFTLSNSPRKKIAATALCLFLYSGLLLAITMTFNNKYISPIFALVGHELIIYFNKYKEKRKIPLALNPIKGLIVSDVKRKSIAYELGIKQGDVIFKINDALIEKEDNLKDIMATNPDRFRFEYFNYTKGLIKKNYKGKNKTLGIIALNCTLSSRQCK